MSNSIGLRLRPRGPRVPDDILTSFAELQTVHVTDAMRRFNALDATVRPLVPGAVLCGRALTVRPAAGDNLAVYLAMRHIEPGDVLVIESRGQTSVAQWGDTTSLVAREAGAAGAVLDGAVRDVRGIVEAGMPVFGNPAVVANGSTRVGPGEINVPVSVGGVAVLPGDLVFGDDHGVVVVPADEAASVLEDARAVAQRDAATTRGAAESDPAVTAWVDEAVRRAGYPETRA